MPCRKVLRKNATAYLNDVQARSHAKETRSEEACAFVLLAKEIRKCDTNLGEVVSSYEEGDCECFADSTSVSKNIKHSL